MHTWLRPGVTNATRQKIVENLFIFETLEKIENLEKVSWEDEMMLKMKINLKNNG